jgi:SAM-dependent methyltransferase
MEKQIIQDYGKTVTPDVYMDAIQGHQYIPQADQCILNIIKKHCEKNQPRILDLGCGPGRLTFDIAKNNCHVIGLDISESFIQYANERYWEKEIRKGTIEFQERDFAKYGMRSNDNHQTLDMIVMQGVMHHIHGEDRSMFLHRCFEYLKPSGILIIGDEFIRDYENEDERISNVCKFYLHIIDEARKGGFHDLAREEAKNLIDDVLSGQKGAGFASEEVFEKIYNSAELNNKSFYEHGYVFNQNISGHLIPWLKKNCSELEEVSSNQSFNRGDYKVSINVFEKELLPYGFVLTERYKIGPVEQLGGMGVLVFKKY